MTLKVRVTEEMIDYVQRNPHSVNVANDEELRKLKKLRDQTYEDIRSFVKSREKVPWREWDP